MRRALRAEEMLRGAVVNCGRSCGPPARRQTGARGHDRHVAGHHASATQLRVSGGHAPLSGLLRTYPQPTVESAPPMCGSLMCATFENRVPACSGAIPPKRLSVPNRLNADHAEAAGISAPPREEAVTGPEREPAEAAPSAPAKAKAQTPTTSESEERHIRRRPEWTIETRAPHRSRPPRPRAAVPHPAPVVIRRPAPGLKANPRPTVVRLPGPVAIAIRSPTLRLIRHPDLTVVGRVFPGSVRVQILRSDVILVSVAPRRGLVNHVVALAVPAVPVIALWSRSDLVLAHRRRNRVPSPCRLA